MQETGFRSSFRRMTWLTVLTVAACCAGLPASSRAAEADPPVVRAQVIDAQLGLADLTIQAAADGAAPTVHLGDVHNPSLALRPTGDGRFTARVYAPGVHSATFIITDGEREHRETVAFEVDPSAPDTPTWAKGAVWYQVFPERYRNGNPANDPDGIGVTRMPWTADWWTVTEQEITRHHNRVRAQPDLYADNPDRPKGVRASVIWNRRYGGDLQGVVQSLDHMRDLGVTALYLCPVFDAESLHKYDAADYRHVDPTLGDPGNPHIRLDAHDAGDSWTPADRYLVDVLLPEARRRGIRVILDGVFNHTGIAHFAFRDVWEHGVNSPYKDWYFCEFDEHGRLVSWRAWDRPNGRLPKLRQTANGDLAPPVKQHIFDITSRWMDPNGDGDPSDGIDGWRLDVALDIGDAFWRDWRTHVKAINADAIIIGEIWHDARDELTGDTFDAQMHYPFARAVTAFLGREPAFTASDLSTALDRAFDEPAQVDLVQMNLLVSHDTERLVSMLANPGRNYDEGASVINGQPYDTRRPDDKAYARSALAAALLATYPGSPMLYGGQELGMHGADDPDNRKPVQRPGDAPPSNRADRPSTPLLNVYRAWLILRRDERIGPVLRYGDVRHIDTHNPRVFAFERWLNDRAVVVVINVGSTLYTSEQSPELTASLRGEALSAQPLSAMVVEADVGPVLSWSFSPGSVW